MAIGLGETLAAGDAQGLADDPEGNAGPAVFRPDRKTLQLREAAEEPQPKAGRGFAVDPAQQVHAAEVVAVEFLVVGAVLAAQIPAGHVDDGADGGCALEIVHGADDRDLLAMRCCSHRSETSDRDYFIYIAK
jgi:hypothetical protein